FPRVRIRQNSKLLPEAGASKFVLARGRNQRSGRACYPEPATRDCARRFAPCRTRFLILFSRAVSFMRAIVVSVCVAQSLTSPTSAQDFDVIIKGGTV